MSLKKDIDQCINDALLIFSRRFGAEAYAKFKSRKGRVLAFEFGGNIRESCCAPDYFEDLALILEEQLGTPFGVWDAVQAPKGSLPPFSVTIVELDFLDQIRKAMALAQKTVNRRIREFERAGRDEKSLFGELSYCVLTANFSAEGGIRVQREVAEGFITLDENALAKKLRSLGYRFPATRANYIVGDRALCGYLGNKLKEFQNGCQAREWLVENVKGFGYKEASHFLRNVGFKDVAIIDRHILKFLNKMELLEMPKSLSKKKYLNIERLLQLIANKLGITLSELDLYLWNMMTGKILK